MWRPRSKRRYAEQRNGLAKLSTSDRRPGETDEATAASTADLIVDAAIRILGRDGYQKLTARSVASEANTNLALINYYFGGKQGLLLAVYDALERQRYERQSDMYAATDEPLSAKWWRAVEFYRRDLEDGFVRIHHELLIQGIANADLAERTRQRISAWNELLVEVAEQYVPSLGIQLPPELLTIAFSAFWYGMEEQHLIGVPEDEAPFFEILERIGRWIETAERPSDAGGH